MTDGTRDPDQLRILALVLAQPAEDGLDVLRDLLPWAPWLRACIAELETIPLEHWQAEHTRLFVNGWPRTVCPPFESAYRQGRMKGSSTGELAGLYRRAGLQATEAPVDYLGTMLECAAWLGGQEDGADLLGELEHEHLRRWVPRFACDLREGAALSLYRGLADRLEWLYRETEPDD